MTRSRFGIVRRLSGAVLLLGYTGLAAPSCGPALDVADSVHTTGDKVANILRDALDALKMQSSDWQKVLSKAIDDVVAAGDKIVRDGQSTVSHELNDILQRGEAAVGADARCSAPFVAEQIRKELERLILGDELPDGGTASRTTEPAVCRVVPEAIDLTIEPARRTTVTFYGYGFDKALLSVAVRPAKSENVRTVPSSRVGVQGGFTLSVNIQPGEDLSFSSTDKQLVLQNSGKDLGTVNFVYASCGALSERCCGTWESSNACGQMLTCKSGNCATPDPTQPMPTPSCGRHLEAPCKPPEAPCKDGGAVPVGDPSGRVATVCKSTNTLEVTNDKCSSDDMQWEGLYGTWLIKKGELREFYVPGGEITWFCAGSRERTGCPRPSTNYVTIRREPDTRRAWIDCRAVN